MTVHWGVDLGVRSFTAAGIHPDGRLELASFASVVKGKIADQDPYDRSIELVSMTLAMVPLFMPGDDCWIEEPPQAGNKNPRTFMKLAQASAAAAVGAKQGGAEVTFVPVDSWKKGTVGRGGADKELVARWLARAYPGYHAQCDGDQNAIDATCIAVWGRDQFVRAAVARDLDQARSDLAVS